MATWLIQLKLKFNGSLRQHRKSTLITWFIEGRAKWLRVCDNIMFIFIFILTFYDHLDCLDHKHPATTATSPRHGNGSRTAEGLQHCISAGAQDATRLEPLVWFFFCFVLFYFTNYIQIFKVFVNDLQWLKKKRRDGQGLETHHLCLEPTADSALVGPNDGRRQMCSRGICLSSPLVLFFFFFHFSYYINAIYLVIGTILAIKGLKRQVTLVSLSIFYFTNLY
jgi:hypothetical protein